MWRHDEIDDEDFCHCRSRLNLPCWYQVSQPCLRFRRTRYPPIIGIMRSLICSPMASLQMLSWILAVLIIPDIFSLLPSVTAYPILMQIDEGTTRCIRFMIPIDDDAHLIFVPIPNEDELENDEEDAVEAWYIESIYEMTKKTKNGGIIPNRIEDTPPTTVAQLTSTYLQESGGADSELHLRLTNDDGSDDESSIFFEEKQPMKYFTPTVWNHVVRRAERQYRKKYGTAVRIEPEKLLTYKMCFHNRHDEQQIQVIFDIVLVSEDFPEDRIDPNAFDKEQHLSPLERSLDQSISSANTVLREMKYMELREKRMRQTADSINTRVRWFSYLSMSILLLVTYVQVTYLKRYFHKKKLM
jgi:p24 family protein delta-1